MTDLPADGGAPLTSATPLEQAFDDYLRAPETLRSGRHLAYDEADLRLIAQRLPGLDDGWAAAATVQDLTDASLRTAFGKYLVDSTEQDVERAARTWRAFVPYLARQKLVDASVMSGVPPPPPTRSRLQSVILAPSRGLILTIIVPILLVMAQEYIGSVGEKAALERTVRSDRLREAQVGTIAATTKLFDDLSILTSGVLTADLDSPDLREPMRAVRTELVNTVSAAQGVLVSLPTQFPDLDRSVVDHVAAVYNLYVGTIESVTIYLEPPETDRARREALVGALLVIQGNASYLSSQVVVEVLHCLLDLGDGGAKRACGLPRADAEARIHDLMDELESEVTAIRLHEQTVLPVLASITTSQAQEFRAIDRDFSIWLAEHPDESFREFPGYEELQRSYYAIDRNDRLRDSSFATYTEAFILDLAEYFDFKDRTEFRPPAAECDVRYPNLQPCVQPG